MKVKHLDDMEWPVFATLVSGDWHVIDICLDTGFLTIDACGILQPVNFDDVIHLTDDAGDTYYPEELI